MELRDIPGAEYIPRFAYFPAGLFELFAYCPYVCQYSSGMIFAPFFLLAASPAAFFIRKIRENS